MIKRVILPILVLLAVAGRCCAQEGFGFALDGIYGARFPTAAYIGYTDTDTVAWAVEPIEYLTKYGIVSGDGDGKFRPLDHVSNAEYIKMLVDAFGLFNPEADMEISYISSEEWYYNYYAGALQAGIIKEKKEYLPEEDIDRIQMAVISYNALKIAGLNSAPTFENEFTDHDLIDEEYISAVYTLKENNIISGDENVFFHPNDSTRRAEACKVVYNLIKLTEKNQ